MADLSLILGDLPTWLPESEHVYTIQIAHTVLNQSFINAR